VIQEDMNLREMARDETAAELRAQNEELRKWVDQHSIGTKVVDPDWFNTDPEPAFFLNPDPEPDPDPS
jgi:hypothetical protein